MIKKDFFTPQLSDTGCTGLKDSPDKQDLINADERE